MAIGHENLGMGHVQACLKPISLWRRVRYANVARFDIGDRATAKRKNVENTSSCPTFFICFTNSPELAWTQLSKYSWTLFTTKSFMPRDVGFVAGSFVAIATLSSGLPCRLMTMTAVFVVLHCSFPQCRESTVFARVPVSPLWPPPPSG